MSGRIVTGITIGVDHRRGGVAGHVDGPSQGAASPGRTGADMSDRTTELGSWIELPDAPQGKGPYRPRLDYGHLAGVRVVGGRDGTIDTTGGSGP